MLLLKPTDDHLVHYLRKRDKMFLFTINLVQIPNVYSKDLLHTSTLSYLLKGLYFIEPPH